MIRLTICIISFVTLLSVSGCAPSGPQTYTATGNVTFDGQPISEGEIIFRAADGATGSWEGKIVDGRFELPTTAGAKRVEITARRKVESDTVAESGESPISFVGYIPERYNDRSELTAEVTAAGPNVFDFQLVP